MIVELARVGVLLQTAAAISLTGTAFLTFRNLHRIRGTSLRSAWSWGLAAQFAWFISCALAIPFSEKAALLDQFWLWSAILALCPLISVLGSRRPTDKVWNLFIILPLIAVLGWPALAAAGYSRHLVPVRLQLPAVIGFGLVLLMGVGNYLGTRFAASALLAATAIATSLLPLFSAWHLSPDMMELCRGVSALLLSTSIWLAWLSSRRPSLHPPGQDRLWSDFRDAFGVVWAIRLQERVNATAEQERWPCRLGPTGVEWNAEVTPEAKTQTITRLEQTSRWLLRRFVDDAWVARRVESRETRV